MVNNKDFTIINIREYLKLTNKEEIGESALITLFSDFSCPQNPDVEDFLKRNAIIFTKKNQSVTYLVFSNDMNLIGYFCIALKSLVIKDQSLSNKERERVSRLSELDKETLTYTVPAFLIAQLGKNFNGGLNNKITGFELLNLAWREIKKIQDAAGGTIVFLETIDNEKLLKFYTNNGFKIFNSRISESKNKESHELIQLLKSF